MACHELVTALMLGFSKDFNEIKHWSHACEAIFSFHNKKMSQQKLEEKWASQGGMKKTVKFVFTVNVKCW